MSYPVIPSDTPSSYINPDPTPTIEEFNGTLVIDTVDTMTFVKPHVGVKITNINGAGVVQYTVDGSVPAVGTSPELPAIAGASAIVSFDSTDTVVVNLLSHFAATVAVQGLDEGALLQDDQTVADS
jgi:hypothetical protein